MRRALDYLDQIGLAVVLVIAEHLCLHALTGQSEGDEHHPLIHAPQAHAFIGELVDAQLNLLMVGEGDGIEFAWRRGKHAESWVLRTGEGEC